MRKLVSFLVLAMAAAAAHSTESGANSKPLDEAVVSSVMVANQLVCASTASLDQAQIRTNSTLYTALMAANSIQGSLSAEVLRHFIPKVRCEDGLAQIDMSAPVSSRSAVSVSANPEALKALTDSDLKQIVGPVHSIAFATLDAASLVAAKALTKEILDRAEAKATASLNQAGNSEGESHE